MEQAFLKVKQTFTKESLTQKEAFASDKLEMVIVNVLIFTVMFKTDYGTTVPSWGVYRISMKFYLMLICLNVQN